MMYVLMIFIGITIGLIISKLIDVKKAKIDEEFLNLVDKVIFEESKEKKTNPNKIRKNLDDRR